MNWISFRFQDSFYCIRSLEVAAVLLETPLTRLARLPLPFSGVFHFRGRLVAALDFIRIQGKVLPDPVSQFVIFAEPYDHLSLRAPGLLSTLEMPSATVWPLEKEDPIVEGTVSHGDRNYQVVSASKFASYARTILQHRQPE